MLQRQETFKRTNAVSHLNRAILIIMLCILVETPSAKTALARIEPAPSSVLREEQLAPIAGIVEEAIRNSRIPGAVILIGNQDKIIYRQAFGYRSLLPAKLPMTSDTIFDIASLTKVVATTTAIMQLVEKDQLRLEDPVANYWPEFKANGKRSITVRELLTHYSGLRADLSLRAKWSGYNTALKKIIAEKPAAPHGKRFIYSDINFEILGEIVHRLSGQTLDAYCDEHIFKPLGMKDTGFRPSPSLHDRIAPTEYQYGKMLQGEVHDPAAYRMGGVAGHAGLFSTADNLSIFAQMLLSGGSFNNVQILSPLTVEKMTMPQSPPGKIALRGFGWDINAPFASNREDLFPAGSFGHTGYTGTFIWIDPVSKTYIIILTNRVHPDGKGNVKQLRADIVKIVAAAIGPVTTEQILAGCQSLNSYYNLMKKNNYNVSRKRNVKVRTGIDVLKSEKFASLSGLRVGLITNHSGLDAAGQRTVDLLYKTRGVKLKAIFSPEHGFSGTADEIAPVSFTREQKTGLRVYSLYGKVYRPSDSMLKGLDALVFDIQDSGARFYTYITTLAYAMEAAARKGIDFYVLDRPNPITASMVQGPVMDEDLKSFTGYFPLPVRHGMTVGELAKMFNAENKLGVKLHVIKMRGYERTDWYDKTGLRWVNPSPNLRSLTGAVLYPGVAMVEGANVSVGRGTNTPFELFGAPWINAEELANYLNNRKIQGVSFIPAGFTPTSSRFKNELCHGVQIVLADRQVLDPTAMGVEIISALYKLYPEEFQVDRTLPMIGSRKVLQAIKEGQEPDSIVMNWQDALSEFNKIRSKYLLY
ncbi:MAG: DUF1343 domain-containing protein [Thermodesulfovibrionales bacterium]|nr:DUF1343 domain-containing protein [Thermodesulfovibrionales bacterium]MDP3111792.1 DUF1343 domain-containing protein [Thermodesulfovibrionales bacterium]